MTEKSFIISRSLEICLFQVLGENSIGLLYHGRKQSIPGDKCGPFLATPHNCLQRVHTRTHACAHAHTHKHIRTHARTRTHERTHAHAHDCVNEPAFHKTRTTSNNPPQTTHKCAQRYACTITSSPTTPQNTESAAPPQTTLLTRGRKNKRRARSSSPPPTLSTPKQPSIASGRTTVLLDCAKREANLTKRLGNSSGVAEKLGIAPLWLIFVGHNPSEARLS